MFAAKHQAVVVVRREFHFINNQYKGLYLADFDAKGLDTVGVTFEISANLDFGNGVMVEGVVIFRLTDGV